MPDRIDLNLALRAQLEGQKSFVETDLGVKLVRKAVQDFSEAQANGIKVAQAYKYAIDGFKDKALESGLLIGQMTDAVKDATTAMNRYRLAEAAGLPFDDAMIVATVLETEAQEKQGVAWYKTIAAMYIALPTWAMITVAIGAAMVLLSPFTALLLSAAVVLTSFAVAGAGFLAVAGAIAGGFGLIGAGVLLLGGGSVTTAAQMQTLTDRLTNAQEALVEFDQAYTGSLTVLQQQQREQLVENIAVAAQKLADAQGPIASLMQQFAAMRDALGAQAGPYAQQLTDFIASFIPNIQGSGSSVIGWFGSLLPDAIKRARGSIHDLTPDFENLGRFIAKTVSGLNANDFWSIIESGIRTVVIPAIEGLITNLVRLADWFVKELPTYGPIVNQIFSGMGTFIQGFASTWASLTDWVAKNWPQTVKDAKTEADKLGDAFKNLADPKGNVQTAAQGFIDFGLDLKTMSDDISSVLDTLGKLNAGLQPIADVLNAINNATTGSGSWIRQWLLHDMPGLGPGGQGRNPFPLQEQQKAVQPTGDSAPPGAGLPGGGPGSPGRPYPGYANQVASNSSSAASSGGSGTSAGGGWSAAALEVLKSIDDHLQAIRTSAPGITAAAATRRNG